MTLRTGEDILIWRMRLCIALYGGIVLEEALDLSSDRILNEWMNVNTADCILVSDSTFVTQVHIVVFLTVNVKFQPLSLSIWLVIDKMWLNGWNTCFIFRRSLGSILARRLAVLSDILCALPQSRQEITLNISHFLPHLFPFVIH